MIKKILNNVFLDSKFLCVEIMLKEDAKEYHAIEVLKNEDGLSIIQSFVAFNFDELITKIPKNRPTLLSFTGQGIISKKLNNDPDYRSKLLFNATVEDFYWYELQQQEYVFASVIRKNILEKEISEFEKHKVSIVDVSIGSLVISVIKPLILKATILFTQSFKLEFKENKLVDFNKKKENHEIEYYDIDGEQINTNNIVPFSNLLNYLFPSSDIIADKDFLIEKREEYTYKKRFNIIGVVALPLFLGSLLISYLLLNYYQTQYIDFQVEFSEEKIAYDKMIVLEKDRVNKERMLKESGLNDSNFLSFYVSEITKEVPKEISLLEFNIFPSQEKIKQGERINFINNLFVIKGVALSNKYFTDWIKAIKKLPWIKNIEIVDFRKEGKTNSFEIKLTLEFNV